MTSGDPAGPELAPETAVGAVADVVARHRPASRRLRRLVALLTGPPRELAELVRLSAVPRPAVAAVLAAAAPDLMRRGDAVAIRPSQVPVYAERFRLAELERTEPGDPLDGRLSGATDIVAGMTDLISRAPAASANLDHVPATPKTVVRRALWLDSTYDLAGAVLVCVGDHDLTSLALGQVQPGVSVVVVDVDEATLEFIDEHATAQRLDVRCFEGDLRFGLPAPAARCADLVFTDPPYTPQGMELFVTRGLEALRNRDNGRLIVAYGYSERHPTLGVQGQSVACRLGLAYEAMLPAFNRYDGAQAVGSASDLYVWRPTSRTWRAAGRRVPDATAAIYTRGMHAVESSLAGAGEIPAAVAAVTVGAGIPIRILAGPSWRAAPADAARLRLETLLADGIPAGLAGRGPFAVAADLSDDPGPWLLRVLLAANADRVAALVPGGHPDAASRPAQQALAGLIGPKYSLRFLHGQPGKSAAMVVADVVDPATLEPPGRLARRLLDRAHGKVGNVWREGLVEARRELDGSQLTKRDARAIVERSAGRHHVLDAPLIALPRHAIATVLHDAAASAAAPR